MEGNNNDQQKFDRVITMDEDIKRAEGSQEPSPQPAPEAPPPRETPPPRTTPPPPEVLPIEEAEEEEGALRPKEEAQEEKLKEQIFPAPTEEGPAPEEVPTETPEELLGEAPPAPSEVEGPAPEPIEEAEELPAPKTPYLKYALIGGGVLIAGVAAGVFLYNLLAPAPEGPEITKPPKEEIKSQPAEPTTPPAALVTADETETLTVPSLTAASEFTQKLQELENTNYAENSIVYLPIFLNQGENPRYFNIQEFFSLLNIIPPDGLAEHLGDEFMLYLYTPTEKERLRCAKEEIYESACYSPRLGAVLSIEQNTAEAVKNSFKNWENEDFVEAWMPLVLGDPQVPEQISFKTADEFSGYSAIPEAGVEVRYINFPLSTTSGSYAVTEKYAVFATSKYSVYEMLDKILSL